MRDLLPMIHSKNRRSGFTLIEVLFAVAMVGVILIPIYALQGQIMSRIIKTAGAVQRIMTGFSFFLEGNIALERKEKTIEKRDEASGMYMHFTQEAVKEKSQIGKAFDRMFERKAAMQWTVGGKKQTQDLIAFHFEPPEPPKEKEEASAITGIESVKKAEPQAEKASAGGKK